MALQRNHGFLKTRRRNLPRVDAIGGSSAGVYVNNRVMVASLFRGVPTDVFNAQVKDLFLRIKKAWNNIPFEIVNDGEVTALAGSMSLNENAVLGVAMGSSEAAGFVTPEGRITTWLNELAFAPVDYNPKRASRRMVRRSRRGAQYFSQQCVGRLIPRRVSKQSRTRPAGKTKTCPGVDGQRRRPRAQDLRNDRHLLGYGTGSLRDFLHVQTRPGPGPRHERPRGTIIVDNARRVLREEFPELNIQFHVPDEKEKRHGQAIAAASLPKI